MSKYLKSSNNNTVPNRIALMQTALALCIAGVLLPALGGVAACSAALAGGISALSSWNTGRKIFNSKAKTAEQFVQNIYLAQFMKLLLVIALFCVVFASVQVDFPVFVITYTATLAVYGLALVSSEQAARG